jgi:hypothetical protein
MAGFQNWTVLSGAMMTVGTAESLKTPAKKEIALSRVKMGDSLSILHLSRGLQEVPYAIRLQRGGWIGTPS